MPVISFPDLPVSARRDEIAQAIRDNQVVIVAGETGSGKTTQLPKICLQLGRGVQGMIGHTQPRRLAAHAVATRIAQEMGQQVGKEPGQVVGYQVRFTDQVGPTTLVKLMTDGILLAEIQSDPMLRRYDTLIIDEAHERSLNIDFILGYLARLLPLRPDLKVIITSATIDSARFAAHFGRWEDAAGKHCQPGRGTLTAPAPVIEVSGRTYPVEIRYRPLSADLPSQWTSESTSQRSNAPQRADGDLDKHADANQMDADSVHFQQLVLEDPDDDLPTLGYGAGEDIDQEAAICAAVDELCAEGEGDILVFLPGERDIRDVQHALVDHLGPRAVTDSGAQRRQLLPDSIEILPLYARLTAAEQQRIFEPHSLRRIVLATNVAETSLTVPGIRYVIDPGLARISRYSNRTKVQRLPIEPVSQASANQRAGRCGRVSDGVAIRLYSQRDYEARPAFTEPEILRTSLASVILQMAALGLGSVADFPFLDAPDSRAVRDGVQLLVEIGALEYDEAGASGRARGKRASQAGGEGGHGDTAGHVGGSAGGDNAAASDRVSGAGRASDAGATPNAGGTRLTRIGRDLARLPIDPRLGRILLEADANGCASEVLVIVAALSLQDVRERPLDHQQAADTAHARFTDPTSDFITYLNLWRYLNVQSRDLSGSAFRRMCRAEFLHHLRWREWRDIVNQLRQLARPLDLDLHPIGMPSGEDVAHAAMTGGLADAAARAVVAYTASTSSVDADQIHRSLLVGLLSNLGSWDEAKRDYEGARGTHFTIWPGSGLAHARPAWVMTAELVETSRLFARTVARINPDWIEPVAGPLLKRVYSEPYWSTSKGAAMVKEKVLLYGMTLVADRSVLLGRVETVFGEGGVRRSSVARPGTLAGIAQGLRAAEPRFDVQIRGIDRLAEASADERATERGMAEGAGAEDVESKDASTGIGSRELSAGAATGSSTSPGLLDANNAAATSSSSGITARELAREMLIRHGLVRGEWREVHRFQKDNERLLEQAREVERRSRTHGLVADEEARVAFFDDLIPDDCVSARHFDKWWKQQRRSTPDLLTYPMALLLPRGTGDAEGAFPDSWEYGDMSLPLSYQFNPGSSRDGVTMTIPIEVLERVSESGTDWLVPGLFEELVTESIRALPKAKRRLLAPAPEVGAKVAAWIRQEFAGGASSAPICDSTGVVASGGAASGVDAHAGAQSDTQKTVGHGEAAQGDPDRSNSDQGNSGQGTPAQGKAAQGKSAQGKSAQGNSAQGNSAQGKRAHGNAPQTTDVDPMSLSAAMDRLAAWGARTGHTRASQGQAQKSSAKQAQTQAQAMPQSEVQAPPDGQARTETPEQTDSQAQGHNQRDQKDLSNPSSVLPGVRPDQEQPLSGASDAVAAHAGTNSATAMADAHTGSTVAPVSHTQAASSAHSTFLAPPSLSLDEVPPAQRPPFATLFADGVRTIRGVDLSAEDLAHVRDALPSHLQMTFVVVDRSGKELGAGTSLPYLQKTLANQADAAVRRAVRGAVAEALEEAQRRGATSTRRGQKKGSNKGHSAGRVPADASPTQASAGVSAPACDVSAENASAGGVSSLGTHAGAGKDQTTATASGLGQGASDLHIDGLTAFPASPLPRSVDSRGIGGMVLRGYPCLVPQGTPAAPAAGVRVMANPGHADRLHREGLARLLAVRLSLATARITTRWTGRQALMLAASPYADTAALVADAQLASALSLVDELAPSKDPSSIRDAAAFDALAVLARDLHEDRVYDFLGDVVRAMEALSEVQGALKQYEAVSSLHEVTADVQATVNHLVHDGFLSATPAFALPHLARYLRAGAVRLAKAASSSGALNRDCEAMDTVHALEDALQDARDAAQARPFNPARNAHLVQAEWMIQELRVSLFAQTLGTPQKVSAKRVRSVLAEAGA
ncbi:DUF3418 domain-containing protein [Schaalia canis]|uniref:DUF3418 domain-containing protein n=1 Tax=Schaalia canis TaxID=100469 RepID=UPI0030B865B6